ncbi:TetR/AcrR family transcriptional regulator [Clostridioides sp. ZZV15-6598]|uniref:TetR/AcrR family transcriptional regulator n=1 Tax=Clostridioides sp. ZZV15-6598 TaxID=2811501 RepID=UPI0039BC9659
MKKVYAKTQINQIAKAVEVSVGTIYLNFAGKKEIMDFILKCTIEPDFLYNCIYCTRYCSSVGAY